MPAFDGTGPAGAGPMTGRGRGFCVLQISKENPGQLKGLAGVDAKPAERTGNSLSLYKKEVIDMPFGDATGPAGAGPMTGRAAGFCAGFTMPGYINPVAQRARFYGTPLPAGAYGFWPYSYRPGYGAGYVGWSGPQFLRRGFAFRRGLGRGRGRGRGRFGYWW